MSDHFPEARSLGDGIHIVPVPLPFESPPWVNCYAIETPDGVTLIDCGCDWEPGRVALEKGLAAVGLAGAPITTLIVSHLHPDHVGMAGRMMTEHGCRFVMHRTAARRVDRYNDTEGFVHRNLVLARRHGVPDHAARSLAGSPQRPAFMPVIPPPDVVVDDGDRIQLSTDRHLEVLHTPGHEASHICLRDSRTGILFSGDHVLPRISPVIMFDEDQPDVLADYLTSLRRLLDEGIGVTYPAHGGLIDRGAARVEQLILHHERRLGDMRDRVSVSALTAWEMVGLAFRPNLTPEHQRLALRETVAHLEHLRIASGLDSEERDGILWYHS